MPRLEHMTELERRAALFFPCLEFATTPWTPLRKPLSESRLALVTSAGLHLRTDKPFSSNYKTRDYSYRVIPSDTEARDILMSHTSIGFDHTGIYRDVNVAFPLDRARELVDRGVVGSLARHHYSFMGALLDLSGIIKETGPEVAQRLKDDGVDVVLLTPV